MGQEGDVIDIAVNGLMPEEGICEMDVVAFVFVPLVRIGEQRGGVRSVTPGEKGEQDGKKRKASA